MSEDSFAHLEGALHRERMSGLQRSRVVGGSWLASFALSAAVITGFGVMTSALRNAWRVSRNSALEGLRRILHRALPWGRRRGIGSSAVVDQMAHRMLNMHARGGQPRQVLIAVFPDSSTPFEASWGQGAVAEPHLQLQDLMRQHMAAQVRLPTLSVFASPTSARKIRVYNARAKMTVRDFVVAFLAPPCRDIVSTLPQSARLFRLSVFAPLSEQTIHSQVSKALEQNKRASQSPAAGKDSFAEWDLSPLQSMRDVLSLLNEVRGARLVAHVPEPKAVLKRSFFERSAGGDASVLKEATKTVFEALRSSCLAFDSRSRHSVAQASLSVSSLPPSTLR